MVGSAPDIPASPQPLIPNGFVLHGTGWDFKNLTNKLIISKNKSEIVLMSDNLLRDDIDNGLTPKDYLDQNIDKTSFLSSNKLIEKKPLNKNKMTGYTYLYKTASVVDITYSRYSVFFDIHQEDKKPKAWIFIKKFRDVNDDNITKVIEASFQKMTEEEISKSKGLRIKVIRFREGMSYKQLADNSPLGRHAEGKLRLLNGHYPNGKPRIGNLIKIVE